MTESARGAALRRVACASLAVFLVVVALLAQQMRSGHDPRLGAANAKATAVEPPKRVLVRRILERRIIVRVVDDGPATAAAPAAPATPVVRQTTPVVSPAPAPAPAPPPVVTRAS